MESVLAPLRVTWQAFRTLWEDWFMLLLLNLIWLVCWLTVILGPPATFGLVHLTAELVDGYTIVPREMYIGAKKYFAKSWAWMLANLLVISVLATNILFYSGIEANWALYVRIVVVALLLLWLMVQFYALPFLILQDDKSLRLAWKNGVLTSLASPLFMFVMLLDIAIVVILTVVTTLPLFLGAGVLLIILGNCAVKNRLESFEATLKRSGEDETPADGSAEEDPY